MRMYIYIYIFVYSVIYYLYIHIYTFMALVFEDTKLCPAQQPSGLRISLHSLDLFELFEFHGAFRHWALRRSDWRCQQLSNHSTKIAVQSLAAEESACS